MRERKKGEEEEEENVEACDLAQFSFEHRLNYLQNHTYKDTHTHNARTSKNITLFFYSCEM